MNWLRSTDLGEQELILLPIDFHWNRLPLSFSQIKLGLRCEREVLFMPYLHPEKEEELAMFLNVFSQLANARKI